MNHITLPATAETVHQINQHHRATQQHAVVAMDHARQAGTLLMKVKAVVGHGKWLRWLADHCEVSPRQAQRYMAVALGKRVPVRKLAKSDVASHLPAAGGTSSHTLEHWFGTPEFLPTPGHWMFTESDEAVFHVVPSIRHAGYFHVSKLYSLPAARFDPEFHFAEGDSDSFFEGTKQPIVPVAVQSTLQHLGLAQPWKAMWSSRAHRGLARPFAEPESDLDTTLQAINSRFPEPAFPGAESTPGHVETCQATTSGEGA